MTQFKHARQLPTSQIILVHPASAAHYLLEGRALVCLVRHGQTDWNLIKRLQGRENVPLNENGHDQARLVSTVIKNTKKMGVTYAAVCTSPLSRAVATAEYIATSIGLGEPTVVDRLIERDYGELSGLTLDERKKLFPGGERQASDVETVPQAAARMLYAIDDMLEVSGRKTVIGVTHGGLYQRGVLTADFRRDRNGKDAHHELQCKLYRGGNRRTHTSCVQSAKRLCGGIYQKTPVVRCRNIKENYDWT